MFYKLKMLDYGIKYAYWIIFRNKVTDTVRKKEIIKRIAIFLYYVFKREDGRDCGGVSTPGHGQGEGPARYEFRKAGRSRLWEGPE